MTKRGDVLAVTCLGCDEEFTYTYAGGRPRKYHDPDHRNATGELTHCHWHFSNTGMRKARAERAQAEEQARVDALVDARIRDGAGVLTVPEKEQEELVKTIVDVRWFVKALVARDPKMTTVEDALVSFRETFEKQVLPLLDRIEALLRR